MKEIAAVDPKRLIVTDPPNGFSVSAAFERFKTDLLQNNPIPPIVVVAHRPLALLILDGNCRAYLLAYYNRPIHSLVLTRDPDRDLLLELQHHHKIPPFPHREYLMEKMNLSELKLQAIHGAQRYGFLSVRGLLDMDIDSIEPVPLPTVSETVDVHVPTHEVSGFKPVECLVLYDRQGEHFLPIAPTRLKEARGSGYDCVKVNDLLKIQDGIAWAREHWDRLDATVRGLADALLFNKY